MGARVIWDDQAQFESDIFSFLNEFLTIIIGIF